MKRKTYKKEYEVESIVDKEYDVDRQEYLYLIKWKGYPHSQNTWEPIEHLQNPHVRKMVQDFDKLQDKQQSPYTLNEQILKSCLMKKLTEFLSKHAPSEDELQEIILSDFSFSQNQNHENNNNLKNNKGNENEQQDSQLPFQQSLQAFNCNS